MDRDKFIATLQACYFGDKGAFNLIMKEFNKLHKRIDNAIDYIDKRMIVEQNFCLDMEQCYELTEILKDSDVNG